MPNLPYGTRCTSLVIAIISAVIAIGGPSHAKHIYTTFDVPGSTTTLPISINGAVSIAGIWADDGNTYHGFVRASDGTITTFDPKGSESTSPYSINAEGTITGYYMDSGSGLGRGFVRHTNGIIRTFACQSNANTSAVSINDKGAIAGACIIDDQWHGFVCAHDGTTTIFAPPTSTNTGVAGINSSGEIAGDFIGDGFVEHGYLRATDGTLTTLDIPGSGGCTQPTSLNDEATITGIYCDSSLWHGSLRWHAFLRLSDGTITTFDPPRSKDTYSSSINRKGTIAGAFSVHGVYGVHRAFLRFPDGTIRRLKVPGDVYGSWATGISTKGAIIGYYSDNQERTHGFLRTR